MKYLSILLILLCFSAVNVTAQNNVNNNSMNATPAADTQFWTDTQIIVPLDKEKKWNLHLQTINRFGNSVSQAVDNRAGFFVLRRMNKNVFLGGGYQYRVSNPSFRRSLYESRYYANATFTIPFDKQKVTITNRNLLEYRSQYSRPDTTVYRNRTQIGRRIRVFDAEVTPFFAFEAFYDFRLDAWARERYTVGVTRRFNKTFSADFFFLRQNEGGGRIGTVNAPGVNLRFNL